MKKIVLLALALVLCGGAIADDADFIYQSGAVRNNGTLAPLGETFFGMHHGPVNYEAPPPAGPLRRTHVRVISNTINNSGTFPLVFSWDKIETAQDVYAWGNFDTGAAYLASIGAKTVVFPLWVIPTWAKKGNNRTFTVTDISIGSPPTVSAAGHNWTKGMTRIFFYGDGTLPSPLAKETSYCIPGGNIWEAAPANAVTIVNCNDGSAITTSGSFTGPISATMTRSNPASQADLQDFIQNIYTRFQTNGLTLVMEGMNEWGAETFYQAGKNDVVTLQNWLWTSAKAISPGIKVLMAPTNDMRNNGTFIGWPAPFPPNVAGTPTAEVYSIHGYNDSSPGYDSKTNISALIDQTIAFARSKGFRRYVVSELSTENGMNPLYDTSDTHANNILPPATSRLGFNAIYLSQFISILVSRRIDGVEQVYPYIWHSVGSNCNLTVNHCYALCSGACTGTTGTPNVVGAAVAQMIAWYTGTTDCTKPSMVTDLQEMLCLRPGGKKQQTVWHSVYANTSTYTVPPWAKYETDIAGVKTLISGGTIALTRAPKLLTTN